MRAPRAANARLALPLTLYAPDRTGRDDIGGTGDIHHPAATHKRYRTTTPDSYDLQNSNATKANRTVR